MGTSGLLYTPEALGPQARGCIYQANHECTWYNYYIPINVWANQYNYSLMTSLYLYGDLLDCIVGLNLMIKTFLMSY